MVPLLQHQQLGGEHEVRVENLARFCIDKAESQWQAMTKRDLSQYTIQFTARHSKQFGNMLAEVAEKSDFYPGPIQKPDSQSFVSIRLAFAMRGLDEVLTPVHGWNGLRHGE